MKKNKSSNKKKIKGLIVKILIILAVIAIIGIGVYYFLTAEDEESSLTLIEKQWIEKNKTTLIDIKVPNNIYILSESGDGALFSFLSGFEESTGLTFNKIPYNYPLDEEEKSLAFVVLKNNNKIKDNDVLIFEDNYILLSNKAGYLSDINEVCGATIGILSGDSESIVASDFCSNAKVTTYNDVDALLAAVKTGLVNYGSLPRYTYLKEIIETEDIFTNYSLNNISNKVVFRLGSDERLNNILIKSLDNWLEQNYILDFEEKLMSFYETNVKITELEKSTLTSKVYKYGYVSSDAYNTERGNKLYGVAGEYINTLQGMLNMEFEYIKYNSVSELKKAFEKGNLDVAFINFNYENESALFTSSAFSEKLVAISNDYQSIDNKTGLINRKLYMKDNNYLYDYFKESNNVKKLDNYSDKISEDGFIILDEANYLALKDSDLEGYTYLFTDTFTGNYSFILTGKNEVLYNLLEFVLNNTDYNSFKVRGINNLVNIGVNQSSFKEVYFILLTIILLPIIVIFLSIVIIKNAKKLKISRKENILRYNDVLTNLKNRNYLNDNIDKWDDSNIYPRTIIIIDLNNLKYVNDNYGHEEGNQLIKQAAAILINTQLEKSDIIRSDGNEFLIYLLGYSKSQVSNYISKLSKEFEKLPYGFGAALGYSAIEDEIKTVDDAINEATIAMRMDKEQNYR